MPSLTLSNQSDVTFCNSRKEKAVTSWQRTFFRMSKVYTHLWNLFSNPVQKLLILEKKKKNVAIQEAFFPLIELNSLFRVLNTVRACHLNHIICSSRKAFQSLGSFKAFCSQGTRSPSQFIWLSQQLELSGQQTLCLWKLRWPLSQSCRLNIS